MTVPGIRLTSTLIFGPIISYNLWWVVHWGIPLINSSYNGPLLAGSTGSWNYKFDSVQYCWQSECCKVNTFSVSRCFFYNNAEAIYACIIYHPIIPSRYTFIHDLLDPPLIKLIMSLTSDWLYQPRQFWYCLIMSSIPIVTIAVYECSWWCSWKHTSLGVEWEGLSSGDWLSLRECKRVQC